VGLPLFHAEDLARALRGSFLCHAVDPPPAALSGHATDGRRLEIPHAAFVALPGPPLPPEIPVRERANAIAGAAVVLPRGIDALDRQAILLAAARWERSGLQLRLGRLGVMHLARAAERRADREAALRRAEARLEAGLSQLRDTKRRIDLHERTLVVVTHDHGVLDRFDRTLDFATFAERGGAA